MSAKPFHLGWFLHGSSAQLGATLDWGHRNFLDAAAAFPDMARALERACFDYILLEDSTAVSESLHGSSEVFCVEGLRCLVKTKRSLPR